MMPLARRMYSFPALSKESFHGLPGLLADSLPDRYGTKLIERYLIEQGKTLEQLINENPKEKNITHAVLGLTGIFRFWSCYDALVDRTGGVWHNRI